MIPNAAHLHLLLNHTPIFGFTFGILILIFGMWRKSADVIKTAFLLFVLTGLVTIAVDLSGDGAKEIVERMPGIEHERIHEHEEAADYAFWAIEITAALALLMFVFFYKSKVPPKFTWTILILALFTAVVIGRTNNLGGEIHHPEIRDDSAKSPRTPDDLN